MRIAATRKMVSELNKRSLAGIHFEYITMSAPAYSTYVDWDIFAAYDHGDYNISTGKFRAIMAMYAPDCYAVPRYITTKELNSLYQAGDTIGSYTERVIDYMTI